MTEPATATPAAAPSAPSTASQLRQRCAEFARPVAGRAVWQLINTLVPFAALWALMAWSVIDQWNYLWTLLLALPTAGLYVRTFIIQHDCGHGSFFASQRANDMVGRCLGVVTLFPYGYWKKTHAIHHGTSGNLDRREVGDIETLTVAEYRQRSWFGRFCYRFYRSTPVLLGIGPMYQFVIKHRFPFDMPFTWKKEWLSVLLNNLTLAIVFVVMWWTVGWHIALLVHLPVVLIAGAGGVWLFYVQHTFEGAYWTRGEDWNSHEAAVSGSSFYDLPQVMHWFTGNIAYHHIHHLASRIPNYRLREAFESSPVLQQAPRLTIWSSLRCARLKLWDEDLKQLVGFPKRVRA